MRQALPWLALVAASVALLGCGSDDAPPEVSAAAAGDLANKLDEIQERVDRQDCPAADDALASLSAAVPEIDANERFRDDFSTLLADLQEQIASQCSEDEADPTTTTSTDEEDEDTSSTSSTTTTTTTTTEETSTTDEAKEPEEEEESTTTEEPTLPETPGNSPVTPPGQGGGDPGSGGIAPGSFKPERKGRKGP